MKYLLFLCAIVLSAADRKAAVDQLIQPVLEANAAPGGLVIGLLEDGKKQIFAYGQDAPRSVFEIGSITKTFTTTALAVMV